MGEGNSGNIILVGFSTTGKSNVGRLVAQRLGWAFVDTDDRIVELAGKPIHRVFAEDGEEHFRALEHRALAEVCAQGGWVIATGGGAMVDIGNRRLMAQAGIIVCLEAKPETIYQRLKAEMEGSPNPVVRPMLAGHDPLARITFLKEFRQPFYALADWTVYTDVLTEDEVAEEVLRAWCLWCRGGGQKRRDTMVSPEFMSITARESEAPYCEHSGATCVVETPWESYPIFVGWGAIDELGRRMRNAGLTNAAYIISDSSVFAAHGDKVERVLAEAGFAVGSYIVPAGEASKTIEVAIGVYDWLIGRRAERRHSIVALGGGMVGDLAGFVAATYLRGVPLVQVPTSLLAMVDASIGGKVAVNHPSGKNLVGAFYQPRLVLCDVATLKTLPPRELASGWAEVIKHAIILDPELFVVMSNRAEELRNLKEDLTAQVVGRSAAIKAAVVSEDPKEQGKRIILNYGHTIAHAIEASTDYQGWLHGEAVAVGMMGAVRISQRLGLVGEDVVTAQRSILERYGLPVRCPGLDMTKMKQAMALDKKMSQRAVRWVLLEGIGKTVVRSDVPPELVDQVLEELVQ